MLPYAEDVNYWKTTRTSADNVIFDVVQMITKAGGVVNTWGFGQQQDCAAYMLDFTLGQDRFKIIWPVLKCRGKTAGDIRAARIQAAVMIKHDVKARLVSALVRGTRAAFFTYLALPDGTILSDLANPELQSHAPRFLLTESVPEVIGEFTDELDTDSST